MIVTELITNACKYAYPEGQGEVRITLSRDGEVGFLIVVEDDGCGLTPAVAPRGTGLGAKLIRAMAQSLGTSVDYDTRHRGCRATLRAAIR